MSDEKERGQMVYVTSLDPDKRRKERRYLYRKGDTGEFIQGEFDQATGNYIGKSVRHGLYNPSKYDWKEVLTHLAAALVAGNIDLSADDKAIQKEISGEIRGWFESKGEEIAKSDASKMAKRIMDLAKSLK